MLPCGNLRVGVPSTKAAMKHGSGDQPRRRGCELPIGDTSAVVIICGLVLWDMSDDVISFAALSQSAISACLVHDSV